MIGYLATLYALLIPVFQVIVYLGTDYGRVKAGTLEKIEATLLLGFVWPLVVFYMVKRWKENSGRRKEK